MVRWRELEEHSGLRSACPLIAAAVGHIAHYQIRNRGTIGGSLGACRSGRGNAGRRRHLRGADRDCRQTGPRLVDARDFFLGPLTTCLAHDELIKAVHFPPWPNARRWAFEEFAQRRGDFAFAGIALYYDERPDGTMENAHVGVIGATPVPRRLDAVEDILNGRRLDDNVPGACRQDRIRFGRAGRRHSRQRRLPARARRNARRTRASCRREARPRIMKLRFEVNGKPVETDVAPRTTLCDCLRDHLNLTGTHAGCEHGVCGACTVIVDGRAVRSCLLLAVQAAGSSHCHGRGPCRRR